jgi:hypothetical protein
MSAVPDTPERASPRVLAGARLAQRRRRISVIRRRVVVSSLTLFAAVWGAIFIPLRGGHDPALARSRTAHAATATAAVSAPPATGSGAASATDGSAPAGPDATTSAVAQPSAVTTSQS